MELTMLEIPDDNSNNMPLCGSVTITDLGL